MPSSFSPLRYPGGKAKLYSFITGILTKNNISKATYIEPFAGGAGLALKLLFNNDVSKIVINDYDPAIFAMWYSVLHNNNELCKLIEDVSITIEEWKKQKEIYSLGDTKNLLELGFSTLFLNRTNVSGIITGGVIGGIEQKGNYSLDARFTKKTIIKRIKKISALSDRITLTNSNAIDLLTPSFLNKYSNVFIYCDPPYVKQGSKLYKNSFTEKDHKELFTIISKCEQPWLVTYDICSFISMTYKNYRRSTINLNYSANIARKAQEYAFYSNNLLLPNNIILDNIKK